MPFRYTDLDPVASGTKDFVIRQRKPTAIQIVLMFLAALFVCIIAAVMLIDRIVLAVILFALLGVVGWFVIMQMQRTRDLLMATEFQNSLFASALGINNKFCVIVKRDGNIVYFDRSFQTLFPDFMKQTSRTIDVLLYQGRVSNEDSEKIYNAIGQGVYDKVIFAIRGAGGEFNKIVMSIEPILRPSGFILLRGRDFIEQRTLEETPAAFKAPEMLNKSTITLFSYVMDNMDIGVYMTGPSGNLVYANPMLEQWLDFQPGEITSGSLSLSDIIHGEAAQFAVPDNYEGGISLQRRTGGMLQAFVNQKIIRDEKDKIIGCTGLVHNISSQSDEVKKSCGSLGHE